ncbi:hypothetical protein LOTGIDRAFT_119784 [Lottia gigantea]|uniref:Nibrin n=1 Tax=Lottia gigantea TaxID=225164 RepID=V4AD67_LOTGI|nr:hypothetical protein LOTGIDRAFT_119784 [Lottia gigantea]ESO93050.1 hypothetical protein LOTGIDRAFT_119784 [Lottia gigantea]
MILGEKHVFLCGKEYIFGRKDCDIVLSGDPSVSRKHASITVTHSDANLANPDKLPIIQLKDLSKFGTFVGSKKVDGDILLQDGTTVLFGSPKSGFMVVYEPFIITTSCLDSDSKKLTRSIMKNLGAHVVNEYRSDCNLLVMNSISVTIKVVCALINQNCIVTPKYLEDYQKHLQGQGEKPDPQNYLPTVIESQVDSEKVSFLPNNKRRNVFTKMKFIFFSPKQFKKMKLAVELSDGIPLLLEDGLKENDKSILYEPGTVVMTPSEAVNTLPVTTQKFYHQVSQILTKKAKTMIGDSEVGYAVLYCSTEKHCNPDIPQPCKLLHNLYS